MTTWWKIFNAFIVFFLVSVSVNSQVRKMKTKGVGELEPANEANATALIPKYILPLDNKEDSVTLAEIMFNPEIRLINPDTFKLETSRLSGDSALLRRDSTRIIDVHPQDVVSKNVLKIETKNKKAFIEFYGSIRVNGAEDFNGLQSKNEFNPYFIPVGGANSNVRRFYMSASQTRIGVKGTNKTDYGPVNFTIEGDFNGNNSIGFRIRHAYGQFNNVLAGQTWSVFGDPFSIPWTVDVDGPNSSVNTRTVQIRYSKLINENFRWMLAVEAPDIDFSSDSVSIYQGAPDFDGRIKYMMEKGHLQAAMIFRSLGARNNVDQPTSAMGIGGLLSGKYDIEKNLSLLFQVVAGRGISRYIMSLKGTGSDLALNPGTGVYEPLPVYGGFISLEYGWRKNIYSFLTPGFIAVNNFDFQPDNAFSLSAYFSVNAFWDVTSGFRAGAEYSFGSRVNKDKEFGTANRISFILYYSF